MTSVSSRYVKMCGICLIMMFFLNWVCFIMDLLVFGLFFMVIVF